MTIDDKRIEGILRGLIRYKRVNEEDMSKIAHIIGEYLQIKIESKSYRIADKPLHEALDYYLLEKSTIE